MRITRKITKKLTSIIALSVMVAALLAVVAVTQSASAQSQSSDRKVSEVALGHNPSWHLLIVWEEPAAGIPSDYRVMWAKSSENYKTWTDESGNAFPTTNSHSVMDVERGVEYKVKVRARYGDGSGPWSDEVRYTVPPETTPEPTQEPTPEPTPEPESDAPTNEAGRMPEHIGFLDWTDVDGAVRYELEVGIGGSNPGWSDITGTGAEDGTRAFVNASSAIIAVAVEGHQPIIRVRGVFEDGTATDWMAATFRPD